MTVMLTYAALAVTLLASASSADLGTFNIAEDGSSRVSFEIEAAFQRVVGTSTAPQGRFTVALDAPEGVSGWVRVPVASLSTGYPERDKALGKPSLLDAARHPTIEFRLSGADFPEGSRIAADRSLEGIAIGTLTLKGKSLALQVPIKVGWEDGTRVRPAARLHIETRFLVKLSDYGVGRGAPGILVSDEAAVAVDLYAEKAR